MSDIRCDRCGAGSERIRELLAEIEHLRASRNDFKELAEKCCRVRDERDAEIERFRAENVDLRRRSPNGPLRERSDFEKDMM